MPKSEFRSPGPKKVILNAALSTTFRRFHLSQVQVWRSPQIDPYLYSIIVLKFWLQGGVSMIIVNCFSMEFWSQGGISVINSNCSFLKCWLQEGVSVISVNKWVSSGVGCSVKGKTMLTMLTTTWILWVVSLAFLGRSFLFGMGRLNIF